MIEDRIDEENKYYVIPANYTDSGKCLGGLLSILKRRDCADGWATRKNGKQFQANRCEIGRANRFDLDVYDYGRRSDSRCLGRCNRR